MCVLIFRDIFGYLGCCYCEHIWLQNNDEVYYTKMRVNWSMFWKLICYKFSKRSQGEYNTIDPGYYRAQKHGYTIMLFLFTCGYITFDDRNCQRVDKTLPVKLVSCQDGCSFLSEKHITFINIGNIRKQPQTSYIKVQWNMAARGSYVHNSMVEFSGASRKC